MLFNSFDFIIFAACFFGLYFFLSHRWQNYFLILASFVFYAGWNWKFIPIMLLSVTVDFFCAQQIEDSSDLRRRKIFLLLGIMANLLILGFFKYFNFFVSSFQFLLKSLNLEVLNNFVPWHIILPIGISFYTFEAISYLVDVYRKEMKASRHYPDYLLFILYFPHLVAGPIMRAKSFFPQIIKPRKVTWEQWNEGCYLFAWGLFEKLYVADNMAKIVNPVFAKTNDYTAIEVWIALYAFAFQIFCDFDGYSNMARGLGKCMGFELSINFKLPYFAVNPRDFWQRWHISLSAWLRDYLYIPLGGNRHGKGRMYIALLTTMLLGGLWHGASATFIVWGLYHGVLLVVYRIAETRGWSLLPSTRWGKVVRVIFFFHLIVIGWLFFRAQSLEQVWLMGWAMTQWQWTLVEGSLLFKLIAFSLPLLLVQLWQYQSNDLMVIRRQHWLIRTIIYAFITYLVLGWGVMRAEEFIYFQF